MRDNIKKINPEVYDVVVIGGGINGAAVAHLSALQGWKVALFEKNDFASGASSKSTKLVHGGLRYLENLEFDLVSEALRERAVLIKAVPHLVKPISFFIPVYKNDIRSLWKMKLGVWLYDLLCGSKKIGQHVALGSEETAKQIPFLRREGLEGGVMYFDAQMDDARLCLENILAARSAGARVMNYVHVVEIIKKDGKAVGVKVFDLISKETATIKAKQIVCATGPWTNEFLSKEERPTHAKVRTTKGTHIVYRDLISPHALFVPTDGDKRVFFIIPFHGHSLIGTTDTDYDGRPEDISPSRDEIEYLFHNIQRVFPGLQLDKQRIVTSFSGLRPLVFEAGFPSKISRKHVIERAGSGIVYIMGGKYTTYRAIAQDCVRHLAQKAVHFPSDNDYALFGSGIMNESSQHSSQKWGVNKATISYLKTMYGTKFEDVLKLTLENPALKEPLCACSLAILAQIEYSRRVEMAINSEDVYFRRLGLDYVYCENGQCRSAIDKSFATHFL